MLYGFKLRLVLPAYARQSTRAFGSCRSFAYTDLALRRPPLLRTPSAALPTLRALSVPNQRMPRQKRARKSRDPLASPARIELATNALGKHCGNRRRHVAMLDAEDEVL